ncbi:hypothetical protein Tco_1399039 [Tanacetum coccineum]
MSQDVLLTVMNSMSLRGESVNMDGKKKESCNLEAELLKSQNAFNDLLKRYLQLEKHYKDSTICKLKDIIKSMRGKSKEENVKYDYGEIETKNVELENKLSKGANSLQAEEQDIPPPTITAMKIPIIRKGEYDIWSMRMRQHICHTDHNLWDTAKQLAARRNQERVKSILLLAIPDEYLLKFHNIANAKNSGRQSKSRFGGNVESKKMQKNVLKHQFENFSTTSNESLDKVYDRFQKLISQLEVHGALISKEDINQKFLRSLPSSWNQIALIMRNKPDIDDLLQ